MIWKDGVVHVQLGGVQDLSKSKFTSKNMSLQTMQFLSIFMKISVTNELLSTKSLKTQTSFVFVLIFKDGSTRISICVDFTIYFNIRKIFYYRVHVERALTEMSDLVRTLLLRLWSTCSRPRGCRNLGMVRIRKRSIDIR